MTNGLKGEILSYLKEKPNSVKLDRKTVNVRFYNSTRDLLPVYDLSRRRGVNSSLKNSSLSDRTSRHVQ